MILNPYIFSAGYIPPSTDPYFSSVVALLHCDGTNGSTTFTDQTGKTWSRNGTTTALTTSTKKYGTAGLLVGSTTGASTNNGIYTASSSDFNYGTADFTIEWFEYKSTLLDYVVAYDRGRLTAGGLAIVTGNSDGKYGIYVGGTLVMTESSNASAGFFEHHALVKNSGVLRKYRSGIQMCSVSNSTNITNTAVCAFGAYSNGTYADPTVMDEIRITKGVCRYPGGTTFTPPTAAFPNS